MQSLINDIQENNWVISKKKGKGESPLFCGNREQVVLIYDVDSTFLLIEIYPNPNHNSI